MSAFPLARAMRRWWWRSSRTIRGPRLRLFTTRWTCLGPSLSGRLRRPTPTKGAPQMHGQQTITVERVDHIGIRVGDLDRALNFYRALGFNLLHKATGDDVAI